MEGKDLLLLHPDDNVALARRDLPEGALVSIAGQPITLERATPTGHKIAIRPIRAGEKVIKYCTPIGSARTDIAPGDYVHVHNLKSDYLPTYTLSGSKTETHA